jgi:hypothetical protein
MATHDEEPIRSAKPQVSTHDTSTPLPKQLGHTSKPRVGSGPLPKRRSTEADRKEASWVHPSKGGQGLAHVGSIFFRTKDHALDARDRELLHALADAYARTAERDKGRRTGAPVWGRVIAYADPRASHAPDNLRLSQLRAAQVASELDRGFHASGITSTIGFRSFEHEGVGVHPSVPDTDEHAAEASTLAPYRRADIFIYGKATADLDPPIAQQVDVPEDKTPKPPDYSNRKDHWGIYEGFIARGHKPSINDFALRVIGNGSDGGVDNELSERLGHYYAPTIMPIKPPWWDTRADVPAEITGRGGPRRHAPDTTEALKHKATALLRDYRLLQHYVLEHGDEAERRYLETRTTGAPDPVAFERLGYIRYMMIAVRVDADELRRMSE